MQYEFLDTDVFNEDRYFDVFVEYAKAGPEDILARIAAANRGPDAAERHLLPTPWFRNDGRSASERPAGSDSSRCMVVSGGALFVEQGEVGETPETLFTAAERPFDTLTAFSGWGSPAAT